MLNSILFKNAEISFSDQGKGTAVLLIHGFLENSTMWNDISKDLVKKNRVISIDLLGHGNSDSIGYIHSMELFADSITAVLKHLKIRRCFVIGHSLGGYVGLAFAEKNIQKIKGLCLLNATSNADSKKRKALRTRAIKMAQTNLESLIKMSISNLFLPENVAMYESEIETLKKEALKTSLQGYIAAQEGMKFRVNRNDILKENNFKKIIIIGKKDTVLDFDTSLQEAKSTNSEIAVLDGGHMSFIEDKEELFLILKEFLKSS